MQVGCCGVSGIHQGGVSGVWQVNADSGLVPVLSLVPADIQELSKTDCSMGQGWLPAAKSASRSAQAKASCLLLKDPHAVCVCWGGFLLQEIPLIVCKLGEGGPR